MQAQPGSCRLRTEAGPENSNKRPLYKNLRVECFIKYTSGVIDGRQAVVGWLWCDGLDQEQMMNQITRHVGLNGFETKIDGATDSLTIPREQ